MNDVNERLGAASRLVIWQMPSGLEQAQLGPLAGRPRTCDPYPTRGTWSPQWRFEERPYHPIFSDFVSGTTVGAWRPIPTASSIALVAIRSRTEPMPEPTMTNRVVLTRIEDVEWNAFLLRLQQTSWTKVPFGLLVKATLPVLMREGVNLCAAVDRQSFQFPSTCDRLALGEFEEQWL